jgi:hypothetical protein
MGTLTTTGTRSALRSPFDIRPLFIESGTGRGVPGEGRPLPGILASWIARVTAVQVGQRCHRSSAIEAGGRARRLGGAAYGGV